MDSENKPKWDDESREQFFNQMRSKVSNVDDQLEEFDKIYKEKKKEIYEQLFKKMKPTELNNSQWQTLINFANAKRKREKAQKTKAQAEKLDTKKRALAEAQTEEELILHKNEVNEEQERFNSMLKDFANGDLELGRELWESTVLGITD